MAPQPVGDGGGVAIGQELRDGIAFQIDDDRAVSAPAPHAHPPSSMVAMTRGSRGTGAGPARTMRRKVEGLAGSANRGPVVRPALREGETEMALYVLQPPRAPGARAGDVRQALAEGAAGTGGIAAAQALQAHAQADGPPLPGQVGEAALVGAVSSIRMPSTDGQHDAADRGTAITVTRSGSEATAMTRSEDGMKGSRRLGMGGSGWR